jgi:hypothetical protein
MAGLGKTLMKRLAQILLVTAASLAWLAAPAHANDPAPPSGSIFDGQWSCEFRIVTKPGGTFVQTVAYDLIHNQLVTVVKSSFQVDKNGSFSWEERENSHSHVDDFYTPKTGAQFSLSWDQEAILKAAGQVVDTKTRALKVTVERWLGSGRFTDSMGGGTIDGSSQTYFAVGRPSGRYPLPHASFVWELKPVSIEQQDLGPDQQREIVTYKGSRGIKSSSAPIHVAGDGNLCTEHIEIRQVRELKLVPRG